jgi:hypothetical protein
MEPLGDGPAYGFSFLVASHIQQPGSRHERAWAFRPPSNRLIRGVVCFLGAGPGSLVGSSLVGVRMPGR